MNGQMVFEFVLATILFFGIIFYVLNYMNMDIATFSKDFYEGTLESKVVQVSELVVGNKGVWEDGKPSVIGLAEEWPVLSYAKIQDLNSLCASNYEEVRQMFDVGHHKIKIQINESGNPTPLLDCGNFHTESSRASIIRYALSEHGSVLSVGVWIW